MRRMTPTLLALPVKLVRLFLAQQRQQSARAPRHFLPEHARRRQRDKAPRLHARPQTRPSARLARAMRDDMIPTTAATRAGSWNTHRRRRPHRHSYSQTRHISAGAFDAFVDDNTLPRFFPPSFSSADAARKRRNSASSGQVQRFTNYLPARRLSAIHAAHT